MDGWQPKNQQSEQAVDVSQGLMGDMERFRGKPDDPVTTASALDRAVRWLRKRGVKPDEAQEHLRSALKTVLSGDRLTRAKQLFGSGHHRAAILEAFIALDVGLRQVPGKTRDETLVIDKMIPIRL